MLNHSNLPTKIIMDLMKLFIAPTIIAVEVILSFGFSLTENIPQQK